LVGSGDTIQILNVKVVEESIRGLCCLVRERRYWVAADLLLTGSTVAHFGDQGTMVLSAEAAEARGLLTKRRRPLRR
jgi:hypothetical protein